MKNFAGILSSILWLVAGFAVVSTTAHYLIDKAGVFDGDSVNYKPRQAAQQQAELVFAGPSHLALGVIPEVFDSEIAKYAKLRSYNLAVGGLSVPQTEALLKQFFAIPPCCLKYVVVYPGFELLDVGRSSTTTRSITYFGLSNALRFWRFLGGYDPKPLPHLEPIEYARNIALAMLRHYSNIGMALSLIGATEAPVDRPIGEETWTSTGHIAIDKAFAESHHKDWVDLVQGVEKALPTFKDEILSDDAFYYVKDIIDLIQANGARVILVRPPSIGQWPFAQAFVRKYEKLCPSGPPLLDFGDPAKYPELYDRLNHVDGSHLNVRGATLWSRMLADQIGELIKSGRLSSPATCTGR